MCGPLLAGDEDIIEKKKKPMEPPRSAPTNITGGLVEPVVGFLLFPNLT